MAFVTGVTKVKNQDTSCWALIFEIRVYIFSYKHTLQYCNKMFCKYLKIFWEKLVRVSFSKDMGQGGSLSRLYHFKIFKVCLPQTLVGSFLNTLTDLH